MPKMALCLAHFHLDLQLDFHLDLEAKRGVAYGCRLRLEQPQEAAWWSCLRAVVVRERFARHWLTWLLFYQLLFLLEMDFDFGPKL